MARHLAQIVLTLECEEESGSESLLYLLDACKVSHTRAMPQSLVLVSCPASDACGLALKLKM
jgi:hypothetical protein